MPLWRGWRSCSPTRAVLFLWAMLPLPTLGWTAAWAPVGGDVGFPDGAARTRQDALSPSSGGLLRADHASTPRKTRRCFFDCCARLPLPDRATVVCGGARGGRAVPWAAAAAGPPPTKHKRGRPPAESTGSQSFVCTRYCTYTHTVVGSGGRAQRRRAARGLPARAGPPIENSPASAARPPCVCHTPTAPPPQKHPVPAPPHPPPPPPPPPHLSFGFVACGSRAPAGRLTPPRGPAPTGTRSGCGARGATRWRPR